MLGQEIEEKKSHYIWFDEIIGKTNSGVYNGIVYVEKHIVINEKHKFFKSPNFNNGSMVYDGQSYFDLELKYDLFEDNLLLKHSGIKGNPVVVINKGKISEFTIDNQRFIKFAFRTIKNKNLSGFFEVLINNDSLKLYKKFEKKISRKLNQSFQYYEFKTNNSYYVYHKGNYSPLNKSSDFNVIFPRHKLQLKQLYRKYEKVRKKDIGNFFESITNDISDIMIGYKINEL